MFVALVFFALKCIGLARWRFVCADLHVSILSMSILYKRVAIAYRDRKHWPKCTMLNGLAICMNNMHRLKCNISRNHDTAFIHSVSYTREEKSHRLGRALPFTPFSKQIQLEFHSSKILPNAKTAFCLIFPKTSTHKTAFFNMRSQKLYSLFTQWMHIDELHRLRFVTVMITYIIFFCLCCSSFNEFYSKYVKIWELTHIQKFARSSQTHQLHAIYIIFVSNKTDDFHSSHSI